MELAAVATEEVVWVGVAGWTCHQVVGGIPCLVAVVVAAAREVEVGLVEQRVGLGEEVIHNQLKYSIWRSCDSMQWSCDLSYLAKWWAGFTRTYLCLWAVPPLHFPVDNYCKWTQVTQDNDRAQLTKASSFSVTIARICYRGDRTTSLWATNDRYPPYLQRLLAEIVLSLPNLYNLCYWQQTTQMCRWATETRRQWNLFLLSSCTVITG